MINPKPDENNTKPILILKNKNLEIHIAHPLEYYNLSRFDWTGKIIAVKFKNIELTGVEKRNVDDEHNFGKGLYNEFGIDDPVGFEESKQGGWFHKIGVGLLKKEGAKYSFSTNYEIQPADFKVSSFPNRVIISCKSQNINGYSYELTKEIVLLESSFEINYHLQNTGEKTIVSSEYSHNFLAINKELMSANYILKFPFEIKTKLFGETVNPEEKVGIRGNEISFNDTPEEQFFFSNLSGSENVDANWELVNLKSKIGISETASFKTKKINLWGWKHVISPELFFNINLKAGENIKWKRTYKIFETT